MVSGRLPRRRPVRSKSVDKVHYRLILSSFRAQYSSDLHPLKDQSLDRIVSLSLYSFPPEEWVTARSVRDLYRASSNGLNLNHDDVQATLSRLQSDGCIEQESGSGNRARVGYRLTARQRASIKELAKTSEDQIDGIVRRLFETDSGGPMRNKECFLEILGKVFAQLGEDNARLVTGHASDVGDEVTKPVLDQVCSINGRYKGLDRILIKAGVVSFFSEPDPEYRELMMNLAQNYFVTKIVGLNAPGAMLSREFFDNSVFLFDTNTVIAALEPYDDFHETFIALFECLNRLDARLLVSQSTLDELEGWVANQRSVFARVKDDIREDIASQVRSPFVPRYHEAVKKGEEPSLDEVFQSFADPRNDLRARFGIEIENDQWFDDAAGNKTAKGFAAELQVRSLRYRSREKPYNTALHDSAALMWVLQQRQAGEEQAWFVTRDRSLPRAHPDGQTTTSLAITLDALLQWIFPIAGSQGLEHDFANSFAHLISERLLPRDRLFDLTDFTILEDMNIEVRNLPSEQLESCLRVINSLKGSYNPSDASDREHIYRAVSRHFATRDKQYKDDIARLEALREQDKAQYVEGIAASQKRIDELRQERENDRSQIESLQKGLERQQAIQERRDLRERGRKRLICIGIGYIVIMTIIAYVLMWQVPVMDGAGGEIGGLAKLTTFFAILVGLGTVLWKLVPAFINKDQLAATQWGIARVFGVEPDSTDIEVIFSGASTPAR